MLEMEKNIGVDIGKILLDAGAEDKMITIGFEWEQNYLYRPTVEMSAVLVLEDQKVYRKDGVIDRLHTKNASKTINYYAGKIIGGIGEGVSDDNAQFQIDLEHLPKSIKTVFIYLNASTDKAYYEQDGLIRNMKIRVLGHPMRYKIMNYESGTLIKNKETILLLSLCRKGSRWEMKMLDEKIPCLSIDDVVTHFKECTTPPIDLLNFKRNIASNVDLDSPVAKIIFKIVEIAVDILLK